MKITICPTREQDPYDVIYEKVDALLCASRFAEIGQLLDQLDVDSLSADEVVAYLSITVAARHLLAARARFVERARLALCRLKGEEAGRKIFRQLGEHLSTDPGSCRGL